MASLASIAQPKFSLRHLWSATLRAIGYVKRDDRIFEDEYVGNVHCKPQCRDAFARAAGIDVATFMRIVTQGLPPLNSQSLERYQGNFRVKIEGDGFSDEYDINFRSRKIEPGYLKSGLRNRGTGRHMFALRAVAGIALGMDRMEINAALAMGAYTWARAGVRLHADDKADLRSAILARLNVVRNRLDEETIARVEDLIQFRRADDLKTLANLPQRLSRMRTPWEKCREKEGHSYSLADYIQEGFIQDTDLTLGQFLVFAQNYTGIIRLSSARQMQKIEDYTRLPIRALGLGQQVLAPATMH